MGKSRNASHLGSKREEFDRHSFDRIAAKYCRKDLLPASRIAREHRINQTLNVLPQSWNASLLEVGCGAGFAQSYLANRFGSYLGVDYSENLIEYANIYNAGPCVHFVNANIKTFSASRSFDVIFTIGVLHHLAEVDEVVGRLVEWLKPGCWLVANEPQRGNPAVRWARWLRKKVDTDYSADQIAFTANELRTIYDRAGLVKVKIIPQGIFATPFAEVILHAQWLTLPLAKLACKIDSSLERTGAGFLKFVTWNLIAVGKRPSV